MITRDKIEQIDYSSISTGQIAAPIHPGVHLLDYLEGANVSQYRLAKEIHVSARRINEIVHGKRGMTADTATRLGRFFDTTPQFWMHLQTAYDLERANIEGIEDITPIAAQG